MARAWVSPGDLVDFLAWEESVGDTQAMVAASEGAGRCHSSSRVRKHRDRRARPNDQLPLWRWSHRGDRGHQCLWSGISLHPELRKTGPCPRELRKAWERTRWRWWLGRWTWITGGSGSSLCLLWGGGGGGGSMEVSRVFLTAKPTPCRRGSSGGFS